MKALLVTLVDTTPFPTDTMATRKLLAATLKIIEPMGKVTPNASRIKLRSDCFDHDTYASSSTQSLMRCWEFNQWLSMNGSLNTGMSVTSVIYLLLIRLNSLATITGR